MKIKQYHLLLLIKHLLGKYGRIIKILDQLTIVLSLKKTNKALFFNQETKYILLMHHHKQLYFDQPHKDSSR